MIKIKRSILGCLIIVLIISVFSLLVNNITAFAEINNSNIYSSQNIIDQNYDFEDDNILIMTKIGYGKKIKTKV